MIEAVFKRNQQLQITAFSIKGHAGYAAKGSDIVCAGVSVLSQVIADHLVGIDGYQNEDGRLEVNNIPQISHNAWLAQTLYDGLIALTEQYPKYMRVVSVEV